MKTMKRTLSILLAVMLLACMLTVPVGAEGSYTITINGSHRGHTYEAYQIFGGDLAGSVLSNIVWGSGITDDGKTALQTKYGKASATEVAGVLSQGNVDAFATLVSGYLDETAVKTGAWNDTGDVYTISGLEAGYYLIKETAREETGTQEDNHAYTKYIVQIVGNVQITPKSGTPTLTKEVKLGAGGTYREAISASVGDTVYFRLTGSLHTHVLDYASYYFQFEDTLPGGLTYEDAEVFVQSGTTLYPVQEEDCAVSHDNGKVTVTLKDIHQAISSATTAPTVYNDKIIVELQTKVNKKVEIGATGNKNTAVLHFSNDPNEAYDTTKKDKPDSLGTTAEAYAMVYAYKLKVKKVDSADASQALEGAEFIVGYVDGDGTYQYFAEENGEWIVTSNENSAAHFTTNEQGAFEVAGLASGTYIIREKVAPAQYNLLTSDVVVQFAGTLDQNSGTLNGLAIQSATGASNYSAELDSGTINLTITNTKGAVLPETGGIGTTVFYIAGGLMVAAAAAVLLLRKRENG